MVDVNGNVSSSVPKKTVYVKQLIILELSFFCKAVPLNFPQIGHL